MKAETTKAMQDALNAAVRSMNSSFGGEASPPPVDAPQASGPTDTIGAIMSILPKLLHGSEVGEEVMEKLESLQKGDLTALREQVLILRKQCHRLLKSQEQLFRFQEQILGELREIQKAQLSTTAVIGELTAHMARVEIIEPASDGMARGPGAGEAAPTIDSNHHKPQKAPQSMAGRARP